MRSPSKLSPTKQPKKEYPLVLLHVTLLPPTIPYSASVMQTVLPASILSNIKLLREKTTPTVLSRGILIPHPQEDYDLLEERLLESLELTLPRILKCGHFHLDAGTEEDIASAAAAAAETDDDDDDDDDDGDDDADICADCGRRVRDARLGSGKGTRRWDIKIYAANGLMRAGAWSAAWREMERVDVEIGPWIGEEMRRDLELRQSEEEGLGRAEEDLNRGGEEQQEEEEEGGAHEEGRSGGGRLAARGGPQHSHPRETQTGPPQHTRMAPARLREIYGADAQAFVDGLTDHPPSPPRPPQPRSPRPRPHPPPLPHKHIPLRPLLKHSLLVAARDRRNIAIFALSVLVLLLSLAPFAPPTAPGPNSAAARGVGGVGRGESSITPALDAVATATAAGARVKDKAARFVEEATAAVVGAGDPTVGPAVGGEVFARVKRGVGVLGEVVGVGMEEGMGGME